jgi:outer membrane biogenesis lipoprotein LolB
MVNDLPNCLFAVYILQMQAIFDASPEELEKELEGIELPFEISFFQHWIKTLPQNTTYFPVFYNDEELAELNGSHIVDKIA